jgi:hypothetical protein
LRLYLDDLLVKAEGGMKPPKAAGASMGSMAAPKPAAAASAAPKAPGAAGGAPKVPGAASPAGGVAAATPKTPGAAAGPKPGEEAGTKSSKQPCSLGGGDECRAGGGFGDPPGGGTATHEPGGSVEQRHAAYRERQGKQKGGEKPAEDKEAAPGKGADPYAKTQVSADPYAKTQLAGSANAAGHSLDPKGAHGATSTDEKDYPADSKPMDHYAVAAGVEAIGDGGDSAKELAAGHRAIARKRSENFTAEQHHETSRQLADAGFHDDAQFHHQQGKIAAGKEWVAKQAKQKTADESVAKIEDLGEEISGEKAVKQARAEAAGLGPRKEAAAKQALDKEAAPARQDAQDLAGKVEASRAARDVTARSSKEKLAKLHDAKVPKEQVTELSEADIEVEAPKDPDSAQTAAGSEVRQKPLPVDSSAPGYNDPDKRTVYQKRFDHQDTMAGRKPKGLAGQDPDSAQTAAGSEVPTDDATNQFKTYEEHLQDHTQKVDAEHSTAISDWKSKKQQVDADHTAAVAEHKTKVDAEHKKATGDWKAAKDTEFKEYKKDLVNHVAKVDAEHKAAKAEWSSGKKAVDQEHKKAVAAHKTKVDAAHKDAVKQHKSSVDADHGKKVADHKKEVDSKNADAGKAHKEQTAAYKAHQQKLKDHDKKAPEPPIPPGAAPARASYAETEEGQNKFLADKTAHATASKKFGQDKKNFDKANGEHKKARRALRSAGPKHPGEAPKKQEYDAKVTKHPGYEGGPQHPGYEGSGAPKHPGHAAEPSKPDYDKGAPKAPDKSNKPKHPGYKENAPAHPGHEAKPKHPGYSKGAPKKGDVKVAPVTSEEHAKLQDHTDRVKKVRENLQSHIENNPDLSDSDKAKLQNLHDSLDGHDSIDHLPTKDMESSLKTAEKIGAKHGKEAYADASVGKDPESPLDHAAVKDHADRASKLHDTLQAHKERITNDQNMPDDQKRSELHKIDNLTQSLQSHKDMKTVPSAAHKKELASIHKLAGAHGKDPKEAKDAKGGKGKDTADSSGKGSKFGSKLMSAWRSGKASGAAIGRAAAGSGSALGGMALGAAAGGVMSAGTSLLNSKRKTNQPSGNTGEADPSEGGANPGQTVTKGLYLDLEGGEFFTKAVTPPNIGSSTTSEKQAQRKHKESYAKRPTGVMEESGIVMPDDPKVGQKWKHDPEDSQEEDLDENVRNQDKKEDDDKDAPPASAVAKSTSLDMLKAIRDNLVGEHTFAYNPTEVEFLKSVMGHSEADIQKGHARIEGRHRHRFHEWMLDRMNKSVSGLVGS